jgi:uncharacterized protein YdiU (UPF0061 family)
LRRQDTEALQRLADYVIALHYPEARETANPCRALLDAVVARQADLVARWMQVGFIHGVMNTDNTSIAAETIDYGPCAFMDDYHPARVYSSIDHQGRYAYVNQPRVLHLNLACLAQALLPLLGEDEASAIAEAQAAIDAFPDLYEAAWLEGMRRKLGLAEAREGDRELAEDLLTRMAANSADFTLTFRGLCDAAEHAGPERDTAVRRLFSEPAAFDAWAVRWRARLAAEERDPLERSAAMRRVNPAFIPRNHLVEEAIRAAVDAGDLGPFNELMTVLSSPYEDQPGFERHSAPPSSDQIVRQTFCGT